MQSMNQRLQAIQNAMVYPLLIVDRTRRLLNFNPAARALFKLNDGDIGLEMRHAGTLSEATQLMRLVESALTRKKEPRVQLELGERSFELQIQLFRNAKSGVEGAVASFVENTEIVRALAENRLNRERLSSILEATPAIVTMKDLSGVYVYANRRFSDMLRARPESILGHTDEELFGKDVGAALREHDLDVIKRKKPVHATERYGLGGEARIWSASKFPLFDAKKRVHSICTISLDMTERIAYEQQLELLKRAFSASNQGVLILEPQGRDLRVSFASDRAGDLADASPARLVGLDLERALSELKLPAHTPGGANIAARMREQPESLFVLPADGAHERARWLEVRSCRFDPAKGGRVVVTFLDVTQRIRDQRTIELQQEELSRITRFSALGEIAAGISHEVNTPLGVIVSKAEILRLKANAGAVEPAEASGLAGDIVRMAKNVSEIVHGLASVVSYKSNRLERSCLRRIVLDAIKLCEPRAHRIKAELRVDVPAGETPVDCYPVQVMQIIINLVNNAIDAIAERRERWIAVQLRASATEAVVTVTDSGPGISTGVAEKIFTPFFTTKQDREGTGIGLSLSRSIARRHYGELTLDSHAANTCFRLVLPRRHPDRAIVVIDPHAAQPAAAAPAEPQERPARGAPSAS
jgi:two-component system CheB/CheR fusion protein